MLKFIADPVEIQMKKILPRFMKCKMNPVKHVGVNEIC